MPTDTSPLTREGVEARLEELRVNMEEANRLERILQVWDAPAPGARRPRGTTATATRAPRGSRPDEFVELVQESPGISASELAAEMGANPNYVYRLAKELAAEGKIEKRDKGFYPLTNSEPDPEPEDLDDEDDDPDSE